MVGRNRFQPCSKRARQARKGNLIVESAFTFKTVHEPDRPIEPPEKPVQAVAAEVSDICPPPREKRQIANKLNCIAMALFVEHNDVPAQKFFAVPYRDGNLQQILRDPSV